MSDSNLVLFRPVVLLTGETVSPEHRVEDPPESSGVSEAPGSSQERPERRSVILYDCSEEELMASIEQEYCH
ncbi:Cystin-1 [Myotis brandtii]|uniref:Cystin-1 n=1 Tax=Myotis brandtii TaxID=109478 RepID=S7MY22_MYOBR|nr:Cystin-1 [Myotis brandtii]